MLKIKHIRELKNITQDEMVRLTGIPKRSYVDYENEKSDISLSKLRNIATALNVTVSELIGETKSKSNVINNNDNENDNFFDTKPKVKEWLSLQNETFISEPTRRFYDVEDYQPIIRKIKFAEGVQIEEQGAPFYPLPVSAGNTAELVAEKERPTGFISIPGVTCKAFFPVVGFSYEPLIRAGDIIGIDFVNKWEGLDPDCIYYIITHEQRMMKRLQDHPDDPSKLLCISPNFREFSIWKEDVKVIHKVVFYGRLV